jgi:hypothetical protein
MEQWDYYPRESGEMIFMKGTVPGKTFGWMGEVASFGPVQGSLPNLEKDKMHLKEFQKPWNLYSEGPKIYAEAKGLEDEIHRLVRAYLIGPVGAFQNWSSYNLLDKFAEMIISTADREFRGEPARDFEAHYLRVVRPERPAISSHRA